MMESREYPALHAAAFHYPAIDNHAHPILKEQHRNAFPFGALISEAQGEALNDSVHTVACYQAIRDLAPAYDLNTTSEPTWDFLKEHRLSQPYDALCAQMMLPCNIQCMLLDDGLGGVEELAEPVEFHGKFCPSGAKRIVRIEVESEKLLLKLLKQDSDKITDDSGQDLNVVQRILDEFRSSIRQILTAHAKDSNVVGFKSIACYRTGLDISMRFGWYATSESKRELRQMYENWKQTKRLRLASKWLIDLVLLIALEISSEYDIPVQFHTGLGDNDITLNLSSPSHLQPVIKAYPKAKFILLHSSYPFTRDAGYLTAVYANVYLDFGEVFPFVSQTGQEAIIRQMLELTPTNKILWSTDGHWFPESFYLGTMQARRALYKVLAEMISSEQLSEAHAVEVVQNALFHNSNRVYKLGLEPMARESMRLEA